MIEQIERKVTIIYVYGWYRNVHEVYIATIKDGQRERESEREG
jgi:hypothetical protein